MKLIFPLLFAFLLISACSNQKELWWCGTGDFTEGYISINVTEFSYKLSSDSLMIEGQIIDSLVFEPLVGANVRVISKDLKEITGAATDIDGKFNLNFKYEPDYIIKFSYIGYIQKSYTLKHFIQQCFEY
jgi:hypothetical protein